MNNKPMELTLDELKEIAAIETLWEMWGAENAEQMLEVLQDIYCVKFNFMSGGPGYVGDLFIVQGDDFGDTPPITLTRGVGGKGELEIVQYSR